MANIFDFSAVLIDNERISLKKYMGKVILIVNTASRCGFTHQYEGLQNLYDKYRDKGLIILGFPCNQFMNQEPEIESDIKQFCENVYHITFPLFKKINVNGPDTHPLYKYLKEEAPGPLGIRRIFWNFTKFLVDRDGKVIQRFQPITEPINLSKRIEELL